MDPRSPSPADILEELVSTIRISLMSTANPQSASASTMAMPAAYMGDSAECGGFLLQVQLYQEMQLQEMQRSKVAFLIFLLSGRALLWAKATWNADTAIINSHRAFSKKFSEVFVQATGVPSISDPLLRLHQGASSTNEYTLQFRTLAATSRWNEVALLRAYRQGLDPHIRAQMAIFDNSIWLESLSACHIYEAAHQSVSPTTSPPLPEPMQVDVIYQCIKPLPCLHWDWG